MSLSTATLPVGSMPQWCSTGFDPNPDSFFHSDGCANSTRGEKDSDFITICCDGEIIDSQFDLWGSLVNNETERIYDLADMICCRQAGRSPGGLQPIPMDTTTCPSGTPTPLASLAATNTDNAQNFLVTWVSASELPDGGLGDWTTTSWPNCMWINTKKATSTTEVVLPAADLTTLPQSSSSLLPNEHPGNYTFPASETSSMAQSATASRSARVTEPASLSSTTTPGPQDTGAPASSSSVGNAAASTSVLRVSLVCAVLLSLRWVCGT